jgi:hypothetical protein
MNQKPSFDITRGEWDPNLLSEYGSLMQTGIYYEFLDPIWHLLYEQIPSRETSYPPPSTIMGPSSDVAAAGGPPPIGPPSTIPDPSLYSGGDASPLPMGGEENEGGPMPPPNQDSMMMGGSEFEDPEEQRRKSLSYIFELRKIYTKLVELESLIDTTQFAQIRYLKDMVTEAIQLLTIVSLNFTTYMNRIPLIISEFYRFITYISKLILFFYQKKEEKSKEESKENYQKNELDKIENKAPDPIEFNISATFPMEGT